MGTTRESLMEIVVASCYSDSLVHEANLGKSGSTTLYKPPLAHIIMLVAPSLHIPGCLLSNLRKHVVA